MSEANDDCPHPVRHWYDFACPFSYVGQSRTALLEECGLDVVALPFQAHSGMPLGGLPVGPCLGTMYTTLEQDARAAALTLHWPARIPNSRKALAAAEWVRRNQPSAFAEIHRKLFHAHFALGEDIQDQAVIDRHAASAGADVGALHAGLADGSAIAAVSQAEWVSREHGVDGTPVWLVHGHLINGLRPRSEFPRVARQIGRGLVKDPKGPSNEGMEYGTDIDRDRSAAHHRCDDANDDAESPRHQHHRSGRDHKAASEI